MGFDMKVLHPGDTAGRHDRDADVGRAMFVAGCEGDLRAAHHAIAGDIADSIGGLLDVAHIALRSQMAQVLECALGLPFIDLAIELIDEGSPDVAEPPGS